MRAGRDWVTAIGADQAVNHQLERAGALIPIHGCDDDHCMSGGPALVDFCHPIVSWIDGVIRVATAWPVTQGLGSRCAAFAGVDEAAVFTGEQAQIQNVSLHIGLVNDLLGHAHEAKAFGRFSGATAIVTR